MILIASYPSLISEFSWKWYISCVLHKACRKIWEKGNLNNTNITTIFPAVLMAIKLSALCFSFSFLLSFWPVRGSKSLEVVECVFFWGLSQLTFITFTFILSMKTLKGTQMNPYRYAHISSWTQCIATIQFLYDNQSPCQMPHSLPLNSMAWSTQIFNLFLKIKFIETMAVFHGSKIFPQSSEPLNLSIWLRDRSKKLLSCIRCGIER